MHNFSAISDLLQETWINNLNYYLQQEFIINNNLSSIENLKEIKKLTNISPHIITDVLMYWWYNEGKKELQNNIQMLRRTASMCLRVDHTYKITSPFGVTIGNVWVRCLYYKYLYYIDKC